MAEQHPDKFWTQITIETRRVTWSKKYGKYVTKLRGETVGLREDFLGDTSEEAEAIALKKAVGNG